MPRLRPLLLDAAYLLAALVTSPIWLWRMASTGKLRTDWQARFGRVGAIPPKQNPRLLLHAVSVGEVNACRLLIDRLRSSVASGVGCVSDAPRCAPDDAVNGASETHPTNLKVLRPNLDIILSVTTNTGIARARQLFPQPERTHASHATQASHTTYASSSPDRQGTVTVVRYPFDFSPFVNRFLNAIKPDLVALAELELWPNFTAECHRRGIPLAVLNGRLSARSFKRYRWIAPFIRPMFRRLALAAVQTADYADRFKALGTLPDRVHITGTMKWDTAEIVDPSTVAGADDLARDLGIDRSKPLIVAGSTAPEEHTLLHNAVASLGPNIQLLCAPRKPEWFDAAAADLPNCIRRSRTQPRRLGTAHLSSVAVGSVSDTPPGATHHPPALRGWCVQESTSAQSANRPVGCVSDAPPTAQSQAHLGASETLPTTTTPTGSWIPASGSPPSPSGSRFLLDTIGELRKAYALADIVVIGRTFVNLHGSDMIEPIGLGKPTIVGPDTLNFEDATQTLLAGRGLIQLTANPRATNPRAADQLAPTLKRLLENPAEGHALAERGQAVIQTQQGATNRHAEMILNLLQRQATP